MFWALQIVSMSEHSTADVVWWLVVIPKWHTMMTCRVSLVAMNLILRLDMAMPLTER